MMFHKPLPRWFFALLFLVGCSSSNPSFVASDGAIVDVDGDASPPLPVPDLAPVALDGTQPVVTDMASGASDLAQTAVADLACTYTHSNGLGKTWTDCVPLGTHNEEQAMKACAASSASCNPSAGGCVGKGIFAFGTPTYTWVYSGAFAGKTITGDCTSPGTETDWD